MVDTEHRPVLLAETLAALAVRPDGQYVDGTVGGGGHAAAILEHSAPAGRLLGLDRDPQALAVAGARLARFGARATLMRISFARLSDAAREAGFSQVDGIVLDLGMSSLQLGDPKRGFSFQAEGPLDMRFDPAQDLDAATIVNTWSEREIADLIYRFADEPQARRIARAIVRSRPLSTTAELAGVVARTVRRRGRFHPATRTFQALRIAVNGELEAVAAALPQAASLLRDGGRLAVISFHSQEDRLVKTFLREQQARGNLQSLARKPITASDDEMRENPRSRSAKLRVAEKNRTVRHTENDIP